MELLSEYGLFLAKIVTVVLAIAAIAAIIVNVAQKNKRQRGELRITRLSEQYEEMKEELATALMDAHQQKIWHKAQKKNINKRPNWQKRKPNKVRRLVQINHEYGFWTLKAVWMPMKSPLYGKKLRLYWQYINRRIKWWFAWKALAAWYTVMVWQRHSYSGCEITIFL